MQVGMMMVFASYGWEHCPDARVWDEEIRLAADLRFRLPVVGFMQAASWGTPDKILRGLEKRRKIVGDYELNVAFRFGGMPYAVAERGLKLFAYAWEYTKGWPLVQFRG